MSLRGRWSYPNADPSILLFSHAVRTLPMPLPSEPVILDLGCSENDRVVTSIADTVSHLRPLLHVEEEAAADNSARAQKVG